MCRTVVLQTCSVLFAVTLPIVGPHFVSAAGSAVSEGNHILRADLARSTFGVTGNGVRVGVISDGILGLDQAKASGDLPMTTCGPQVGGVTTIDPSLCRGINASVFGGAEGTAMIAIIHDLAPGAQLAVLRP